MSNNPYGAGEKDGKKIYVKPAPKAVDFTLDGILKDGLIAIRRIMDRVLVETDSGRLPSKDTVVNLEKCMAMVSSLRKTEQALVDAMSKEDLEKLVSSNK